MGYVGTVSTACLTRAGHDVIGVDVNPHKVELVAGGRSPIVEPDLASLLQAGVASGRLRTTMEAAHAVAASDLALICVSTPPRPNGDFDPEHLETVAEQIGHCLRARATRYTVAVRSTALPGTMRTRVIPRLESRSGRVSGRDFGVCYHPEFLREGSAVADYDDPPKIIIGTDDEASGAALDELYRDSAAPVFRTGLEEAELLKYVDNSWHALKVTFANEIGRLCQSLHLDSQRLMALFAADMKLNISAHYLRPGFAFGGSCLPKDLRALTYLARNRHDLSLPMLDAIMASNQVHIQAGYELVAQAGRRRVGMIGMSFKAGTDDLRGSPLVTLAEMLIGKGYLLRIYDPAVNLSQLIGTNRDFIEARIPHLGELLVPDVETLLEHAETVVIGHGIQIGEKLSAAMHADVKIVDLVGVLRGRPGPAGSYFGLGW